MLSVCSRAYPNNLQWDFLFSHNNQQPCFVSIQSRIQVSHYVITYKWIRKRMKASKVIKFFFLVDEEPHQGRALRTHPKVVNLGYTTWSTNLFSFLFLRTNKHPSPALTINLIFSKLQPNYFCRTRSIRYESYWGSYLGQNLITKDFRILGLV